MSTLGTEDRLNARLPKISVVIPTRNSSKTLPNCLESLDVQKYPRDRIELVVIDAYSKDNSRDIAKSFGATILSNPLITGEAGKAVGILAASGDLILSVDSDNVLPSADWLLRMVEPFADDQVVASEALYYHYDRSQPAIIRYCALIGADDPVSLYLGVYGRFSHLTGRWTDIRASSKDDRGDFLLVTFRQGRLPTMGANGFLIKATILKDLVKGGYLFDVDLPYRLIDLGYNCFARVKVGVLHLYAFRLNDYVKKTYRRVRDYYLYQALGLRRFGWHQVERKRLLLLLLGVMSGFPLVADSVKGYKHKPDVAWFLNWGLCVLSVAVYGTKDLVSGLWVIRKEKTVFQK